MAHDVYFTHRKKKSMRRKSRGMRVPSSMGDVVKRTRIHIDKDCIDEIHVRAKENRFFVFNLERENMIAIIFMETEREHLWFVHHLGDPAQTTAYGLPIGGGVGLHAQNPEKIGFQKFLRRPVSCLEFHRFSFWQANLKSYFSDRQNLKSDPQ